MYTLGTASTSCATEKIEPAQRCNHRTDSAVTKVNFLTPDGERREATDVCYFFSDMKTNYVATSAADNSAPVHILTLVSLPKKRIYIQ